MSDLRIVLEWNVRSLVVQAFAVQKVVILSEAGSRQRSGKVEGSAFHDTADCARHPPFTRNTPTSGSHFQ